MDLRRQIAAVRAWFPLLVASVLLAAGTAFVVSSTLMPKVYEAKTTMIVGQLLSSVNPSYDQILVSQRLSTTFAAVATKGPMLDRVIQRLGLDETPDELSKQLGVDAPLDSSLLTITAKNADPSRAAAIANALAEQLIAASPNQSSQAGSLASIEATLKSTQDQIDRTQARMETLSALPELTAKQEADLQALDGRLASLRSTYATLLSFSSSNSASLLTVVEPAVAPANPSSPNPLLNTLLGAFLGLFVAACVVVVVEHLDDGIRNSDAVLDVTGLSTLGAPLVMNAGRARSEIYRLAPLLYPRSGVAEAYRTLRANIEFAAVDAPLRTLLVTSSISGEGKTVTAANLAIVFAQAGRRVLLVDGDLRKPGVHVLFDLPNAHGLTSLLRSDEVTLEAIAHSTEQANLQILTTGPLPPNPAELMGSQRMRMVLERLQADTDLVVFDSPPLRAVTDAAILSSFLDATLFVIDAKHSQRRSVRPAREALTIAGANVLGVVLNRVPGEPNSDYAGVYGGDYESVQAAKPPVRTPDAPPAMPIPSAHRPGTG